MVDILYPLFCVFSLFQFLWHIFFFPCNSIIYLLCRTIISFRDCCKIYIWIFNFDFAAAAYFSPEQALCCLLSGILVTRWLWCFFPEAISENHTFLFWSLPCLSQLHTLRSSAVRTIKKSHHSLQQLLTLSAHRFLVRL